MMNYFSEFCGCVIFLVGGYGYACNIGLKKTLIEKVNYMELVMAWSVAVGLGMMVSSAMKGPAYLNPGVVIGIWLTGSLTLKEMLLYVLMEFLAAGTAMVLCLIFFWDSFQATPDTNKRGLFTAYSINKNIPLNALQELMATFMLLFIIFLGTTYATNPLSTGMVGFFAVALLALSLNSTGFSLNAMRSFFSSIWFTILPIPNKGKPVSWGYQFFVNFLGSSIGGILAVIVTNAIKASF